MTLLPSTAAPVERALAEGFGRLSDVPVPLRHLWSPATCPAALLPWLAWGVSIDFWDADWSEDEKRAAIAGAIDAQRRKGTRASLRQVLDRFDPLLGLVEWFEDKVNLPPHTFRLELPLAVDSAVDYDAALVTALLRDIAAVKPLRAHMIAVHRLHAQASAGLLGGAMVAGHERLTTTADTAAALDPFWLTVLLSEDGEPLQLDDGTFLEQE